MFVKDNFITNLQLLNDLSNNYIAGQQWWDGWWITPARNSQEKIIELIWKDYPDIEKYKGFEYWSNLYSRSTNQMVSKTFHRDCDEYLRKTQCKLVTSNQTSILYFVEQDIIGGYLLISGEENGANIDICSNVYLNSYSGPTFDILDRGSYEKISCKYNRLVIFDSWKLHGVSPIRTPGNDVRGSFLCSPWKDSKPHDENFKNSIYK